MHITLLVRTLAGWQQAAGIATGAAFRRTWPPKTARRGEPPPLPRLGTVAITPSAVAEIVKAHAAEGGFSGQNFGGHSVLASKPDPGQTSAITVKSLEKTPSLLGSDRYRSDLAASQDLPVLSDR